MDRDLTSRNFYFFWSQERYRMTWVVETMGRESQRWDEMEGNESDFPFSDSMN
jgi:hypothetical protein